MRDAGEGQLSDELLGVVAEKVRRLRINGERCGTSGPSRVLKISS